MYRQLLEFTIATLNEIRLSSRFLKDPLLPDTEYDLGLRNTLFAHSEDPAQTCFQISPYTSHYLCRITDIYHCEYFLLKIPDLTSDTFFLAGPFLNHAFSTTDLYELCDHLRLPKTIFGFIQQYYTALPIVSDDRWIEGMFCSLVQTLWPDREDLCLYRCQAEPPACPFAPADIPAPTENTIAYLEQKYASEESLIRTIRQGRLEEIDRICSRLDLTTVRQHFPDSVRDQKNCLIVLNTICKKAAQYGGVHPVYLDDLFQKTAFSIESAVSLKDRNLIFRQIPRRYCMLVRSHSTAGYSSLISHAISYIDFHFDDEDLSLKQIASVLAVNKSYLSTLFRQETGSTLTAHITRIRMENAVYLLNTSTLSLQEIANFCGISDLNYFIRLFKKHTGRTPGKYRETILRKNREL